MRIDHPDILKFIRAKSVEGKMRTTNISVTINDDFMRKVINNEKYWTKFAGKQYEELNAKDVFDEIIDGAWRNGEPGILYYDRINQNSPYKYTGQEIQSTNPCGEQSLPPNGVCNLGSLDLSKFITDGIFDWELFEKAIRLSVRFLDYTIDVNAFPTDEIDRWAKSNRPVGLGIMGYADYLMKLEIPYGSKDALDKIEDIMKFMLDISYNESEKLGELFGIPDQCINLPRPRRNITTLTVAPTGTISIIAGCNGGIEPFFSEITTRKDKTGTYNIYIEDYDKPYFRCAVASNGATEVTWKEHVLTQNSAQKYVDSSVSKTINFPHSATKEDIYNSFILAWQAGYVKGMTVYRNGSRQVEVLSPKEITKDKCPVCKNDMVRESGCKKCSKCDFSVCEVG